MPRVSELIPAPEPVPELTPELPVELEPEPEELLWAVDDGVLALCELDVLWANAAEPRKQAIAENAAMILIRYLLIFVFSPVCTE